MNFFLLEKGSALPAPFIVKREPSSGMEGNQWKEEKVYFTFMNYLPNIFLLELLKLFKLPLLSWFEVVFEDGSTGGAQARPTWAVAPPWSRKTCSDSIDSLESQTRYTVHFSPDLGHGRIMHTQLLLPRVMRVTFKLMLLARKLEFYSPAAMLSTLVPNLQSDLPWRVVIWCTTTLVLKYVKFNQIDIKNTNIYYTK
jgi:hypothetical protein